MKKIKFLFEKGIILLAIIMVLYLGLYLYLYFKPRLSIESANKFYIYDNDENLVKEFSDEWVELEDISPYLIDATISIEDKKFYKHTGFDYPRILKSFYINLTSNKKLQGASTITQQLSKNLFLSFILSLLSILYNKKITTFIYILL